MMHNFVGGQESDRKKIKTFHTMEIEEKIAKLKACTGLAYPTVLTQDMGLGYIIIDKDGLYTGFGRFSEWPVYKVFVDPELKRIISLLHRGEEVDASTIRNSCLGSIICTGFDHEYDNDDENDGDVGIASLANIDEDAECFWMYALPDEETLMSQSLADVIKTFINSNRFDIDVDWDDADEDDIDYAIEICEKNAWTFPYICINNPNEEDDEGFFEYEGEGWNHTFRVPWAFPICYDEE